MVTKWTQQLWRLAKLTGGIPPGKTHQLYNTVAVPAFTYTSDVWYIPPFKLAHKRNLLGSASATKLLCSIQGQAAQFITGRFRGTAFNVLEAHAYIPPIDLLFWKTQMNAATHICTLPTNHPLSTITQCAARCFINRHCSPLHYLFHQTQPNPLTTKHISTFHRHPFHKPTFNTKISPSKELALELTQKTHCTAKYKVYCNGSSIEGGVRVAAILYKNNWLVKTRRAYLGSAEELPYSKPLVGVLLASSLLHNLYSPHRVGQPSHLTCPQQPENHTISLPTQSHSHSSQKTKWETRQNPKTGHLLEHSPHWQSHSKIKQSCQPQTPMDPRPCRLHPKWKGRCRSKKSHQETTQCKYITTQISKKRLTTQYLSFMPKPKG